MAAMDFDTIRYYGTGEEVLRDLQTFQARHAVVELLAALRESRTPAPHGQRGGIDERSNVR